MKLILPRLIYKVLTFPNSYLNRVNFTGAYMDDVQLGQFPALSLPTCVTYCTFILSVELLAIADNQNNLILYNPKKRIELIRIKVNSEQVTPKIIWFKEWRLAVMLRVNDTIQIYEGDITQSSKFTITPLKLTWSQSNVKKSKHIGFNDRYQTHINKR